MRCDDGVNVSVLLAHVSVQYMYAHCTKYVKCKCTKPTDEKGGNGPFETRIGNRVLHVHMCNTTINYRTCNSRTTSNTNKEAKWKMKTIATSRGKR